MSARNETDDLDADQKAEGRIVPMVKQAPHLRSHRLKKRTSIR
jgi:hypothetical protein